jgi:malate dehydrogenase
VQGTPEDDWVSMAIPSMGDYGIETGLIYSFPVMCSGGQYTIVRDLAINRLSEKRMQATEAELREERDGVKELLG